MKKQSIILALLFLSLFKSQAQQEPIYSQYMINPFVINPAVSSTEDYVDLQSGYRSQWTGFEGAPRTVYLSGHATINKPFYHMHYKAEHHNWHGVGFQVMDDKIGPLQRNTFLLAYSYNMAVFKKSRLSVGSFMGFKQMQVNREYWVDIENQEDMLFQDNFSTGLKPEFQFGAVLYDDNYYVNFSAQNLMGNQLSFPGISGDIVTGKYAVHSFLSAGRKFSNWMDVEITPSFMLRFVPGAPISLDLNGKIDYKKKVWSGISVRNLDSFNMFAGLRISQMVDFTYAYEHSINGLNSYTQGTHELILGFRLRHPQRILDPSEFW